MKRKSFIDIIIGIITVVSAFVLVLAIFSYSKNDSEELATITIIENEDTVIKQDEEVSYSITSLESAGTTIIQTNTEKEFKGNKYYYNQLGEYARIVYQAFENNIDNLKTGNYKIQFDHEFDELLKKDGGNEILNDEFQRAWDAFSYDRPDIFYLDPNKFSITVETSRRALRTTYNVYISCGNNKNYLEDGFSSKQQINEAISKVESFKKQFVVQMSAMNSDYEKIKALHDWIIDNVEYDISMKQTHKYNIYGALTERKVVCEGYAKLFKYILDDIGIECVLASGTAVNSEGNSERHMWNYVKLEGKWYAVDCTWDDPVVIGGGKVGKDIKYKYFLKGLEFKNDHTDEPITQKSEALKYPKISEQDYQK